MLTQSDWISRANAVLPGGGFGNFDPGIVIREGKGSACGTKTARSMSTC
jgi:glutamate-1-semialdehyde 2,1-aminomutase